ncbi:unnamed protein product [Penicillium camemberti]|uniref:Str. FM013 n=1 Tax=Penicillium camemberti (strain FM 013) TaxID=1429867 RepID=A0A0G4PA77_PENC3|nr:unnamed protein product [Penicillium camemberti]
MENPIASQRNSTTGLESLPATTRLPHSEGWPWSTIWGGTAGFATPAAESLIGPQTQVDSKYDPVVQALLTGNQTDAYTGKMISGRAVDLKNRRRVKLYGRMVTGSLSDGDAEQAQLVVHILRSARTTISRPRYPDSIPS